MDIDGPEFVRQLRRHTIQHFGQHRRHRGVLSDPEVVTKLGDVIDAYRRGNPKWNGNDATLDGVPFRHGPAWLRRAGAIPRCTNSLSLYMFLVLDAFLCILCLKLIRAAFRKLLPEFMEHGTETVLGSAWLGSFLSAQRQNLPFVVAVCITLLTVVAMFHVIHHYIPWIEVPHLLLTVVITLYMFAYTSLDHVIPDISVA